MDQKWLRVDLYKAGVLSGVQLPAREPTVGTPLARSLAHCFTSLCKRVLPLPYHVPGRPSFVRSFIRSLARSLARPSIYTLRPSFLLQCSWTGCSEGSRVPEKKPWVYLYERSHKSRRSSSVSRLTLVGYGSCSAGYDPYCRVYSSSPYNTCERRNYRRPSKHTVIVSSSSS